MNARKALKAIQTCLRPGAIGYCQEAVAALSTALDERDALREALEPLNWDDSEIAAYAWCPDDKFIGEVSAGDIRKASAIITKMST